MAIERKSHMSHRSTPVEAKARTIMRIREALRLKYFKSGWRIPME
jgi:hypothetical protein